MSNLPDKLVMTIIFITILFVFGLIFSVKSPERKIIDSPIVAEQKIAPSRAVICILGTFLGFIFGILMASMSLFLLNAILFPVLINYMGLIIGSDFLSITLTNYIQGISSASPFKSYSGGITDTFIYF